uniref:CBM21 domain-containing protein n=1 Tax=Biomphalaria glabrata TaxID=6526 RepID=A0A2C9JP50_BIOGL
MYFCPCSCNDPVDPDVDDIALVTLPRNLSYVQDSYLDRYSVSARYVHNPKAERRLQYELNQANINVGSTEEDETIGLLSVIKAQDYPVNCSGNNVEPFKNTLSPTEQLYSQPESPTYHGAFSIYASGFSKASPERLTPTSYPSVPSAVCSTLLGPAVRVTSKLTSLLHTPPNESMDSARDIGSSVDGDFSLLIGTCSKRDSTTPLNCPDTLGQDMDRGVGETNTSDSNSALSKEHSFEAMNHKDSEPETEPLVVFNNTSDEENEEKVQLDHIVSLAVSDAIHDDQEDYLNPYGVGAKTHYPSRSSSRTSHEVSEKTDELKEEQDGPSIPFGSPDSDGFSEEGVFLNMDDLDNTEKSTTVSEVSDDTCVSVDSVILSPDEADLEEEVVSSAPRKMTLEEAINRAASDLSKMTADLYGESSSDTKNCKESQNSDSDDEEPHQHSKLARAGRESPIRHSSGLKIHINDLSAGLKDTTLTDSKCDLNDSPVYEENEFNFNRVALRKSSSLKTNKTPPGTPHRKKVVRFADAMGLDLESVRHVLNMESPPRIPSSALADLKAGLSEERKELGSKYLCACFNQPGASDNFVQKVISQKVCLENAIITDLTITGVVRVSNISFHKSVRVRYTHNSWATFHDIAASYVQNSCDGPTDRFSFSIVAPPYFGPGSQLEFAVSYNAGGVEYWDNNEGKNYVFECFAKTIPTDNEVVWLHFL